MAAYIKSAQEVEDGIARLGPIWFKADVYSEWQPGIGHYALQNAYRSPNGVDTITETEILYHAVGVDGAQGCLAPVYVRPRTDGQDCPSETDYNYAYHPAIFHDLNRVDPQYIEDWRS